MNYLQPWTIYNDKVNTEVQSKLSETAILLYYYTSQNNGGNSHLPHTVWEALI